MQPIKEDEPAPPPRPGNRRMSSRSIKWDKDDKGFLTEAEMFAKDMDQDGKGYLDAEEALRLSERIVYLLEANKKVRRMIWFLVTLVLVLFAATVAATVMAVEKSKVLSVGEKGLLLSKDGADITVQAHGVKVNTYIGDNGAICVSTEDVSKLWVAQEEGSTGTIVHAIYGDDNETATEEDVYQISTDVASRNSSKVVFGNIVLNLQSPNCGGGDHVHRRLNEYIRFYREGYQPEHLPRRLFNEQDEGSEYETD